MTSSRFWDTFGCYVGIKNTFLQTLIAPGEDGHTPRKENNTWPQDDSCKNVHTSLISEASTGDESECDVFLARSQQSVDHASALQPQGAQAVHACEGLDVL